MDDLSLKNYYEMEETQGIRINAKDIPRYRRCLSLLGRENGNVLDVGCGEGYWLDYLRRHSFSKECVGIELAKNRVERALSMFPDIDIRQGNIEALNIPSRSFDTVTCFEVLEHLPNWKNAIESLIRIARHKVLITVPYREKIRYEICVHCHQPTPEAGHLHSFDKNSFSELAIRHRIKISRIISTRGDRIHRAYYHCARIFAWYAILIKVNR